MSEFSLTLVLQIKTSKIINDMAKKQQKSETISAFGEIFFVLDKFGSILSSVIDSHLGLRPLKSSNREGSKLPFFKSYAFTVRKLCFCRVKAMLLEAKSIAFKIESTTH